MNDHKLAAIIEAQTAIAKKIATKWVGILGLGFHPDTPGTAYVNTSTGARSLTNDQADEYDRDMIELFDLPGDPYTIGLPDGL